MFLFFIGMPLHAIFPKSVITSSVCAGLLMILLLGIVSVKLLYTAYGSNTTESSVKQVEANNMCADVKTTEDNDYYTIHSISTDASQDAKPVKKDESIYMTMHAYAVTPVRGNLKDNAVYVELKRKAIPFE
ncbi:uncharacterized protein LOC102362809 [Latimeria chalumnae]|uniref:uncharacterized protein LOC102362809 n=1 Tax=Latimeria chalumnae TaxID=7897 RepID=UPI00313C3AC3